MSDESKKIDLEAIANDEVLVDEFHAELKKQQAFSIARHGLIALAMYPFIKMVVEVIERQQVQSS